ncbi:MAG: hypothetical protein C4339_05280 [Nitrososphaerota archaeon]
MRQRARPSRRAIQLVEEAILLTVAIVLFGLIFKGVQSTLMKAGDFTTNIWDAVQKAFTDLFSFLWK